MMMMIESLNEIHNNNKIVAHSDVSDENVRAERA